MDKKIILLKKQKLANLQHSPTVKQMACSVNLSVPHLEQLFRREVGASPVQYLRNLRLEKTRELLENTFLRVKEICFEAGTKTKAILFVISRRITAYHLPNIASGIGHESKLKSPKPTNQTTIQSRLLSENGREKRRTSANQSKGAPAESSRASAGKLYYRGVKKSQIKLPGLKAIIQINTAKSILR
ncbi:MAG: helix-turn-helix domain-containing protein [Acidobacteria bacterium]|jgi:AraC-like DNA-binding protein|nr:helix-turn-helix domain-containing protein [Acidobacteriota bacterium]